eukprot:gb/GECG01005121.1/.p1 GENE.gb/GECG01005121.1/~~gb/GECG01005121.1/.p1  ORF type:complete len:155 (+),score=1.64 gb/GECG01005121.1/:1-465(+)
MESDRINVESIQFRQRNNIISSISWRTSCPPHTRLRTEWTIDDYITLVVLNTVPVHFGGRLAHPQYLTAFLTYSALGFALELAILMDTYAITRAPASVMAAVTNGTNGKSVWLPIGTPKTLSYGFTFRLKQKGCTGESGNVDSLITLEECINFL